MYPEILIIKHPGKRLSETNLGQLLEDYQSDEALLRIGEVPSDATFRVDKGWVQYLDKLQKEGHYDIVLLANRSIDRLGGLDELEVVRLSHPVTSFHEIEGNPLLNEPSKIRQATIDQSYTRGDNYQHTFVVGVRNTSKRLIRKSQPTYVPLL